MAQQSEYTFSWRVVNQGDRSTFDMRQNGDYIELQAMIRKLDFTINVLESHHGDLSKGVT